MYLSNIKLKNFRNYDELDLVLGKNINILMGDNAQGKTSLLEAVYVLSRGKSYKGNVLDLIYWDRDFGFVEGTINKSNIKEDIRIHIDKSSKVTISLNGKRVNKRSVLNQKIHVVIFSPEDLKMIKEGPDFRRKFIDNSLQIIKPSYGTLLKNYNKVLFQRNNLLKSIKLGTSNSNTLGIWDEQLVRLGINIIISRVNFLKKVNSITKKIHYSLTNGQEEMKLFYLSNIIKNNEDLENVESVYKNLLEENVKEDIQKGYSSIGPHLDDIRVSVNDYDVKVYGSQGQQRTAALSLKLSEIDLIRSEINENPIILLDDVMSELDSKRQEKVIEYFQSSQVLITCTEISFENYLQNVDKKIYTIKRGTIDIM